MLMYAKRQGSDSVGCKMMLRPLRRLANVAAIIAWVLLNPRESQAAAAAAAAAFQARQPCRNRAPSLIGAGSPFLRNHPVRKGVSGIHEKRHVLFSASNEFLISELASSYPEGTPPGLRGEAIRSAVRSGKCLAYQWRNHVQEGALDCGLLRIQGPGTRAFLHSKLTRSFVKDVPAGEKSSSSSFQSACLLNGKGQVVDVVHVAVVATPSDDKEGSEEEVAFVLTSPGHSSTALFKRLDPFVFPLDRVALTDCSPAKGSASSSFSESKRGGYIFTLAAAERAPLQELFDRAIVPEVKKWMMMRSEDGDDDKEFRIELPTAGGNDAAVLLRPRATSPSLRPHTPGSDGPNDATGPSSSLLIVPYSHVPECAAVGYTFYLWDDDDDNHYSSSSRVGSAMWQKLMDDADGPIHVGPLEWETLRIEAGLPRYGCEITGGLKSSSKKKTSANPLLGKTMGDANDDLSELASPTPSAKITPASPLELHLEDTVDLEKGCYLGQEGVASVLKNPRGPPRTLYQVVFDDELNHYDGDVGDDDEGEAEERGDDNLTRPPAPGDALFVLGSNEEISAGILTSVAEPGGTGEAVTVGLALVPRADSILKRMADRGLTIRESTARDAGSPSLAPPVPRRTFPLDGLEVIVGGTFTVGRLQAVPAHRYRQGENMFLDNPTESYEEEPQRWNPIRLEPDEADSSDDESPDPWESDAPASVATESTENEVPSKELEEAQAAAEAETKRKAEKLELLRKRAEQALAKRRSKKNA
jgi:folate-binding Fe-S cluster repair protein YgfZ